MKTMKNSILAISIASIAFLSCDKDRCDEGYKPYTTNGQEICIPDYLTGKDYDFELGNIYVHDDYGVITLENGVWKDADDNILILE